VAALVVTLSSSIRAQAAIQFSMDLARRDDLVISARMARRGTPSAHP
jgi:hypothetical protein